jgi:hypothetical protein
MEVSVGDWLNLRLTLIRFYSPLFLFDRTGWNFSPKHFFTDSAGMYWRERRLPPGLYTDGTTVYETSYRYKDGRNGMRRVRTLNQFMQDTTVKKGAKDKLLKRIQKDHPDIVVEG